MHGTRVETTAEWFCEAAWDGPFEDGEFDRTDIVTGSGGRLRDNGVTFVASGSVSDRLHSLDAGNRVIWVSNSLVCLLATLGGDVDPTDSEYGAFFLSIRRGIDKYDRWLPTSIGAVQLTYFDNLRWVGGAVTVVAKPFGDRTFADFTSYRGFLANSMARMLENARSEKRTHPLRPLGTLSSGYDSTMVTVLARQAGLEEVISFARGYVVPSLGAPTERDSGAAVAQRLGVTHHQIDLRECDALQEVPFFAADAWGEDVHFLEAAHHLPGRLLLTGNYGDRIWGTGKTNLSPTIVRHGTDGLSLGEFRLWTGFLHCPVPYWGTRSIANIHAISHSEEMKPWHVAGPYNRPIPRRIVEEAGIPRGAFATTKRARGAFPLWRGSFMCAESSAHYVTWLRAQRMRWLRAGRIPPPTSLRFDRTSMAAARQLEKVTERLAWSIAMRSGWSALVDYPMIERLRTLTYPDVKHHPWVPILRRYIFPWALAQAMRRYPTPPGLRRG